MDILGIDIGTISVKYVRYRKKGKGIVGLARRVPLQGRLGGLRGHPFFHQEQGRGERRSRHRHHLPGDPEKTFTIPVIPKEEMKEVLEWSASKIISIPLDDMRTST